MLDIIKKSIYLGLGAATVTKEKVEKLVDELIEKGQLSKEQKNSAVQEIINNLEEKEEKLNQQVKKEILKTIEEVGLPTKKDIDELNKRLKALEKKLSERENIQ